MCKWITCVLILLPVGFSFSQSLRDKVQGDWLCINVTDSTGHKVASDFGEPDRYLRFSFHAGYLRISQAPFDRGLLFPVHFGKDFIDPTFERNWEMPDLFYQVISLDSTKLILKTTLEEKKYSFVNQNQFIRNTTVKPLIKNAEIVISHQWQSANYLINNLDEENFYPSPIFKDDRYSSLGDYLSSYFASRFLLSNKLKSDTLSYECLTEFDVTKRGIQNLKIVHGSTYEFNVAVFEAMQLTRKKWHPAMVNGVYFTMRMRFKFVFLNLPGSGKFGN